MSQTITISAPIAMSAVPALMLAGGLIVGLFLRGDLTTAIEAARLNAENDARTARWLFLRGYRKTPHAGPDLTPEPLALSDRSHADEQADHTDTDRKGMWRVLLGLASELVDRVHDWLPTLLRQWSERDKFGSGEQATEVDPFEQFRIDDSPRGRGDGIREVLAASGYELDLADEAELQVELEAWKAANPPTNPQPYTGRHWVSDVQHTSAWPLVIPKPRDGEVQA